jgi:hypothetical protein
MRLIQDLGGRVSINKTDRSGLATIDVRNCHIKFNGDRPSVGMIKEKLR